MKFGLLIETDMRKRATSPNLKPEVKLRHSGRHLENRYNIIFPLWIARIGRNSAA